MPILVCGNGTMVHLGRDQGHGKYQDFDMPRDFKYLMFFQNYHILENLVLSSTHLSMDKPQPFNKYLDI